MQHISKVEGGKLDVVHTTSIEDGLYPDEVDYTTQGVLTRRHPLAGVPGETRTSSGRPLPALTMAGLIHLRGKARMAVACAAGLTLDFGPHLLLAILEGLVSRGVLALTASACRWSSA